jgi:hypothetical protein
VVTVADDELFGPDGTQALPPEPLLPDPLGGLVTGVAFSDNTAGPLPTVEWLATPFAAPAAAVRRRTTQAGARRPVNPVTGATTPTAIPVAQALPSRPAEARRPTVANRPAAMPVAQPFRNSPARDTTARNVAARPATASARSAPSRPAVARPAPATRRSGGAGCGVFLVIVIVLIAVFVVLGLVLGHGGGGLSGG